MEYKIECEVCLGYSCGGMFQGDNDVITVDLTDEEAQQIRKHIDSDDPRQDVRQQLASKLPDIFEKIEERAFEYMEYVAVDDALRSGLWHDCIQSGRDESDFMEEDIESGAFATEDEEGNPIPEEQLLKAWWANELKTIRSLPTFSERSQYIIERYECEPDSLDGITYTLDLPKSLKG